ncbi:MAG: (2Fe-2S)-binding protein [Pseudonocardia sp.]|uniref:(2Fe-2S)-binding protein n=1 Tax=unclassified Pseudonocardia TaxID=2619320 RepID=UPI00086A5AEB|nr:MULTISPECIES: (2Fe-2S)-binding protein [unclassified Pseudonocardia]MBN9108115.1 (2Fe-2S)-binding protein [Pseudonocardia sp.]ODU08770.1 MAG: (2Fe-2S)-binding protein [Pseudonocardia sp. SCN 72-51]ODV06176.1 MAG: (2Fe-2S)-binding protein [Pseudonocardia sp. SCN 73-27]RTL68491.1 MAG: (2Fe-2S)-binding protein [Pseudonocardiaceae bacterium]
MYVCICAAVSDTELLEYIDDGARTVEEIGEACGAGTNCGGCVDTIDVFLAAAVCPSELSQLPMTA